MEEKILKITLGTTLSVDGSYWINVHLSLSILILKNIGHYLESFYVTIDRILKQSKIMNKIYKRHILGFPKCRLYANADMHLLIKLSIHETMKIHLPQIVWLKLRMLSQDRWM